MHRRTTSRSSQASHGLGEVEMTGSTRPSLGSTDEVTSIQQYWEDEQINENEHRSSGMSRSPSAEQPPPAVSEQEPIPATEAARSRSFRALRTVKACDICKIRKVKCNGEIPCASCRLHNSTCQYSKTTRKKLLSLSEDSARNGQSVIPKNPRGRPMTTDIGNWAITQPSSGIAIDGVADPSHSGINDADAINTKRRRLSSIQDDKNASSAGLGILSSTRGQLPVLDPNLASVPLYQDTGRGVIKDVGLFGIPDTRSPYIASGTVNQSMQSSSTMAASAIMQSGHPPYASYKDFAEPYILPRTSVSVQGSSTKTKDTPSSTQAISVGLMSAPTTSSTPRSGSGQSGLPGLMSLDYGIENALYGDPELTRTASRIETYDTGNDAHHSRQSAYDRDGLAYSAATQRDSRDPEGTGQAWLRSQRRPDTILGANADALGNAGIVTIQPGTNVKGVLWWGPTSFLSLQDRLIQVMKARQQIEPQIDPDLTTTAPLAKGMHKRCPQLDGTGTDCTVWRWGCDKLIFGNKAAVDEKAILVDPLFLPSQLAHRFFRAYVVTIHALYPVMDIDEVRTSISAAYAGGVDYQPDHGPQLSEQARDMQKARDLMVLAVGAQIEGGDGDAHCPKDVARAWSKNLADRSHKIFMEPGNNAGADAIRLWLLYTIYLGNYGQIDEQYLAIGHASRLVLSLGLHRDSTCQAHPSQSQTLRLMFWITYILEKTISLWQGRPSCLNIQGEIDTVLPFSEKQSNINALHQVVDLVDFVDKVQAIYFDHSREASRTLAVDKVNQVFQELEKLRKSVPREMINFHSPDPDAPTRLLALNHPEGELALCKFRLCLLYHNIRILASLPLLSYLVWQDVTKQPFTSNQQVNQIAAECVSSAEITVLAFQVYMAQIPYLPFMSDFTMMLLFAIPVLYLDSLRYDTRSAARRNIEVLRIATGVLQHFDHPAGDVCEKMVQDFFDNYVQRPEWSAPSMQLQSTAMNNSSTGSQELLSWLTSPYERGKGPRAT